MKLVSVDNYEKDAFYWLCTFHEWSKQQPIHVVRIGDGRPSYVDNRDIIKRKQWRLKHLGFLDRNKDQPEKLMYYLLYGDSDNINVNFNDYKKTFKI